MSDKIVHITLPEEVHVMLKVQAAKEGKTLAQMIQGMVIFYCESKGKGV